MESKPILPWPKYSFDGDKYTSDIHAKDPIPKKCTHKGIQMTSGTTLKCKCGIGFQGTNIRALYDLLTKA